MRKFLILLMIACPSYLFAHDHEHPDLDDWYSGLRSKSNSPCCDGSDFGKGTAAHLADIDWESKDGHYRVHLDDDKWYDVPDSAIVDGPNLDGRALVWTYKSNGWGGNDAGYVIRCFLRGASG